MKGYLVNARLADVAEIPKGHFAMHLVGRIVGGSTVDPKYKYPYTAYFQVGTGTLFSNDNKGIHSRGKQSKHTLF